MPLSSLGSLHATSAMRGAGSGGRIVNGPRIVANGVYPKANTQYVKA